MKSSLRLILATVVATIALAFSAQAQQEESHVRNVPLAPAEIDRIIHAFTAKETQFRLALNQYGFKRDATVQTIGWGSQITGEFRRVSRFAFDDKGQRFETVLFAPMATLTEIQITPEDIEDLSGVQTFALETNKIDKYNFTYLGKEKIDELDLYVFDVAPKVIPDEKKISERFFQGRIWVDDQDLQIVKVHGKGVPQGKQRFPVFETYREQIDGKYWFPTYTYADDQLVFPNGLVVHLRMAIKFTDYERYKAKVKVIEGDVIDESQPQPTPTPTPQKKPPM
jgi:hypothetical protein